MGNATFQGGSIISNLDKGQRPGDRWAVKPHVSQLLRCSLNKSNVEATGDNIKYSMIRSRIESGDVVVKETLLIE